MTAFPSWPASPAMTDWASSWPPKTTPWSTAGWWRGSGRSPTGSSVRASRNASMVNIGLLLLARCSAPSNAERPVRPPGPAARRGRYLADPDGHPVNFDDDVKVRYPPKRGFPGTRRRRRLGARGAAPRPRDPGDPDDERKRTVAEAVKVNPEHADAHRRQAGRGRLGPDLRQRQPGDRRGHRPGGRRLAGRDAAGDRRRPARLRRDRLVDQPRVPQALPRAAARGAAGRAGGAARAADPRGRLPADDDERPPARRAALRGAGLPGQAHRRVRVGDGAARRHEHHRAPSTPGGSGASRSAWWAPSSRGTSPSR